MEWPSGWFVGELLREMEQFGQKRAADTSFARTIKGEFGKLGSLTPLLCLSLQTENLVAHTLIEHDLMRDVDLNL